MLLSVQLTEHQTIQFERGIAPVSRALGLRLNYNCIA
jgi:hypothetical protein